MENQDVNTTHEQVAEFYNGIYYRDDDGLVAADGQSQRLAQRLGIKRGDLILDVACGKGDWLSTAARAGAAVSGVDIASRAIEVCRRRMPGGDFRVGPAESLPFPDRYFNLVTCLGSLEHFLDQPKALAEMVRVTKGDGRVLILVPNAGFLTYRLGLYKGTGQQVIRETVRTLDEWRGMFMSAGLDVRERWKDLHVLSRAWIFRPPAYFFAPRLLQAFALTLWPLDWQYQVFHLCTIRTASATI